MQQTISLKTNTLYILSGLPGIGKSTFLKNNNIPSNMIVSSDYFREMILGNIYEMNSGKITKDLSPEANGAVFTIMEKIVEEKIKEGLTLFIDSTNVNDQDRVSWIRLAKRHNFNYEILIFDEAIEIAKERNSNRERYVPDSSIEKFEERFNRTSHFPYQIVNSNTIIKEFEPLFKIEEIKLDIIGDVHGLLNELKELLYSMGYTIENNIISHPENRKLVFLGDVVDRGEHSIEILKLLYKNRNEHFCILGNHEIKLIHNYKHFKKNEAPYGSPAVLDTFLDFLKLKEKDQEELMNWLESLSTYYVAGNVAMVHGNITYFDPLKTLKSDMLYGNCRDYKREKEDTDAGYQKLYNEGINKYTLIRGHVTKKSTQTNILTLEENQAFGGFMTGLRLETYLETKDFEKSVFRVKSNFNYKEVEKVSALSKEIQNLLNDKLITFKEDETKTLKIFKYGKQVFFKNLWHKSNVLLRTRGLVLDLTGKIIQHPFTKVFNYSENGAGLDISDDTEVIVVDKENGFLGCITKHPYKEDLLITTTGSFDSDFVGYIKDFITPDVKKSLHKFFYKNNLTLMFEVIHPNDPHIISYEEKDQGLYLIGARGKNDLDEELSEDELDLIGKELNIRRAKHRKMKFGELKKLVEETNIEGYMVRDAKTNKILLKFKSPYYLTTKFLGRMNKGNIEFMYKSPNIFKEKVDEEFFPIVDMLISNVKKETFLAAENEERIVLVRELINKLRN